MNMKKLILTNLPYLLFAYPFDKLAQAFRLAPGADLSAKLLSIRDGFSMAFASPAPSLEPVDLLIGIAGALILRLAVYLKEHFIPHLVTGLLTFGSRFFDRRPIWAKVFFLYWSL